MLIDGKKLSEEIKEKLKKKIAASGKNLRLAIVFVGNDEVSQKFICQKQKFGEYIGVETKIYNFSQNISTQQLRGELAKIVRDKKNNGVVVQLPLPKHINTQEILDMLPLDKDVDVLSSFALGKFVSGESKILPPVPAAIKTIFEKYKINMQGKKVVVIGRGILVGKPSAIWCMNEKATVSVLNSKTADISVFTKNADVIITGAGKPNLITKTMIKRGAIVMDAGTGLLNGKLAGDVVPTVADKAFLFTPVPGGIGPLTVAMLFNNLIILSFK